MFKLGIHSQHDRALCQGLRLTQLEIGPTCFLSDVAADLMFVTEGLEKTNITMLDNTA